MDSLNTLNTLNIDWNTATNLFSLIFVVVFATIFSGGLAIGASVVAYRTASILSLLFHSIATDLYDTFFGTFLRKIRKRLRNGFTRR